jgi:hypothetical protein
MLSCTFSCVLAFVGHSVPIGANASIAFFFVVCQLCFLAPPSMADRPSKTAGWSEARISVMNGRLSLKKRKKTKKTKKKGKGSSRNERAAITVLRFSHTIFLAHPLPPLTRCVPNRDRDRH